jgi:photosystem II stability/assembly factor-like uncharacterized protein
MKKVPLAIFCFCFFHTSFPQNKSPEIKIISKDVKTDIRGLSVVNDVVVWASGSNGTIGKSTDGGKTWKWSIVKGFEKRDFRDIEAFDALTAIVMVVDAPAYILKTIDGGETWKIVYENQTKGMFLDALEFWNEVSGIVIGDPIDNKVFVARTFDGGNNWVDIPDSYRPVADSGEAFFAASGTNVRALDRDESVLVSGACDQECIYVIKKLSCPLYRAEKLKEPIPLLFWIIIN